MKFASHADILRQSLTSQEVKAMNEAKLKAAEQDKKKRAAEEARTTYLNKVQAKDRKVKKLNEFSVEVHNFLMESAIAAVFDHIIEEQHGDQRDFAIGHGVIKEFVQENGYYELSKRFAGKNLILSQIVGYCEEYYDLMMEAAKDKVSEEDSDPTYSMDKTVADDFVNKIKDLVPGRTIKMIRDRVAHSMEDFLDQQAENKSTIMDIYNKANEKAKNLQSNMVKESAIEDYKNMMKAEATRVYDRKTTMFGAMVRIMTENVYKEDALKKVYFDESGKLNMKLIINDSAVVYTVLEEMNTMQMETFTEESVSRLLKESGK